MPHSQAKPSKERIAKSPRPVTKRPAEQQALESLRESILSGLLKPGERITETALADQLGIARGTLRPGLNRLAIEGIVVQTPYIGWQVADLTADDIWEIWTLRASLEQLAANLVARKRCVKALQAIETAFIALQKACNKGIRRAIDRCDIALHQAIVDGSGHQRLIHQYALVRQQVRWVINTRNMMHANTETILEPHEAIVRAILNGDSECAGELSWQHNAPRASALNVA